MKQHRAEKSDREQKIAELQTKLQQYRQQSEEVDKNIAEHETQRSSIDAELKGVVAQERDFLQEVLELLAMFCLSL